MPINPLLRHGDNIQGLESERRAEYGRDWPFLYAPAWPLRWVRDLAVRDGIRYETLSCGHVLRIVGRVAWSRRCQACYREKLDDL